MHLSFGDLLLWLIVRLEFEVPAIGLYLAEEQFELLVDFEVAVKYAAYSWLLLYFGVLCLSAVEFGFGDLPIALIWLCDS